MGNKGNKTEEQGKFILVEGISGSGKTLQAVKYLAPFLKQLGYIVVESREPTVQNPFGRTIRAIIEGKEISEKLLQDLELQVMLLKARIEMTLLRSLSEKYRKLVIFLRLLEEIMKKIKGKEPLAELERQLLFLIDRLYDIEGLIKPALKEGKIVIVDRYDLSNYAYGSACGVPLEELYMWHEVVLHNDYLVPDLAFFIAVSPEVATKRLLSSGKTIDRYETLETLRKVDEQYNQAIALRAKKSVEETMKDETKKIAVTRIIHGEGSPEDVFEEIKRELVLYGLVPKQNKK
ncbi:MAG: hypothetical protein WCV80_03685 [Candidatus Paceibacterota bacterium]|jgi:thymidylate kinase